MKYNFIYIAEYSRENINSCLYSLFLSLWWCFSSFGSGCFQFSLLFFPLDVFVGRSDGLAVDFDHGGLFVGILILSVLLHLNELVAASLPEQGVGEVSGASLQELPVLRVLLDKISDLLPQSVSLNLLSFVLAKFGLPEILLNLGLNLFNLFLQLFLLAGPVSHYSVLFLLVEVPRG